MSANMIRWVLAIVITSVLAVECRNVIAQEEGTVERRVEIQNDDLVRASDLGMHKTTIHVKVPDNHAFLLTEITYQKSAEHPTAKAVSIDYCRTARVIERSLIVVDPSFFLDAGKGKLKYRLPSGAKGEANGILTKYNARLTAPHSHDPQFVLEFETNREQSSSNESWQRIAVYAQLLELKDVPKHVANAEVVVDKPGGVEQMHGYYTLDKLPTVIEQSEAALLKPASFKQSK